MELQVLGPIAMRTANQDHPLGSVKERTLLAILALSTGQPVSIATLISRIWDDDPPAKARDTVSSYVSRLRRRLSDIADDAIRIVHTSGGYALRGPPEILDLARFRTLVRQARAIGQSGDAEHAIALLRQADELWRGEALAGLPGQWIDRVRYGLEEERRNARHLRVDLELELGHYSDLLGELYDLTARYPLDERLVGQLMLVLYRSDRQADALTLYHQTCKNLSEAQGANPGRSLRELYQQILAGDINLAVTPRHRLPGRHTPPDTLPPDIDHFVGRQQELGELFPESSSGNTIPVVITGMPGVGKTTLAIHAAHQLTGRFPDARLFLDLNGHNSTGSPLEPVAALAMLLRMLEIPTERIPLALTDLTSTWRREMRTRRAVVVLDDAIDARQVGALLPHSPTCAILITSRNRLRELDDCRQLVLDVMHDDEASTLFTQLSRLDAERHVDIVHSAVRHCGHLPLVVNVVARQFRDIDGSQMSALVDALADRTRAGRDPQVAGTFELSCRRMPVDQQEFFRLLGLHPCRDITLLSAAALVARPPKQLEPRLNDLVDRNLIHRTGNGVYRFHDLIRDYANQWAVTEEIRPRAIVARALNYYLSFSHAADQILFPHRRRITRPPPKSVPHDSVPTTHDKADHWMRSEWRNALEVARYAIASEWKERGTHLVHLLAEYLDVNDHWSEAREHHELALRARREIGNPRGIAQSLVELCAARLRTADHEAAMECATEALAIHQTQGDREAEAEVLDYMGGVNWWSGRNREALAYHQEALGIYRLLNHNAGQAVTLGHRGMCQYLLGRYAEAIADFQASLELCEQIGDRRGVARALNNLGDVQQHRGFHRDAIELYEASLEIYREIESQDHPALLNNIGKVRCYKGHYEEALSLHRKALREFRATGDRKNIADALDCIGQAYRLMDAHTEAIVHHEQARVISEEISDSYGETRALRGVADALRGIGRYQEARDRYEQALTLARVIDDTYQEAMIHDGIGQLLAQTHSARTARIHWQQAFDLFQRLGVAETELVRIRLDTMDANTEDLDNGSP
jgi:DNA-binding SARP family transcriptional activator/tetratricopeptide (TPR) repeat protein